MHKIIWCIPTYGDIDPDVYRSHLLAAVYAQKRHIDILYVGMTKRQKFEDARNRLAMALLSTQDVTAAFWVDSDVILPQHTIVELAKSNKAIVSGVYIQKAEPYYPNLFGKGKYSMKKGERGKFQFVDTWEDNKLFEIDGAGFGCLWITREVFEKIKVPHFEWINGESSEDLYFFLKAKEAGFQAWGNSSVYCGHLGDRENFTVEKCREFADKATLKDIHKQEIVVGGEE